MDRLVARHGQEDILIAQLMMVSNLPLTSKISVTQDLGTSGAVGLNLGEI